MNNLIGTTWDWTGQRALELPPFVIVSPIRANMLAVSGDYLNVPAMFTDPTVADYMRFITYPWAYQNLKQGANSGPITPTIFPP